MCTNAVNLAELVELHDNIFNIFFKYNGLQVYYLVDECIITRSKDGTTSSIYVSNTYI